MPTGNTDNKNSVYMGHVQICSGGGNDWAVSANSCHENGTGQHYYQCDCYDYPDGITGPLTGYSENIGDQYGPDCNDYSNIEMM